jgi:hypothetical protein
MVRRGSAVGPEQRHEAACVAVSREPVPQRSGDVRSDTAGQRHGGGLDSEREGGMAGNYRELNTPGAGVSPGCGTARSNGRRDQRDNAENGYLRGSQIELPLTIGFTIGAITRRPPAQERMGRGRNATQIRKVLPWILDSGCRPKVSTRSPAQLSWEPLTARDLRLSWGNTRL